MTTDSVVRVAGPEDYQECWRLMMQGHHENGIFLLAPAKVDWFLRRFLFIDLIPPEDSGIRGIIGVIGPVGTLEAICGLCISELWYSHEKHLADFLVFVDPECRASDHAKTLVEWMKKQSDIIGLPLLSGVVTTKRTEAKCRMFKRLMPKAGEYFFYNGGVTSVSSAEAPELTAH